MKVQGLKALKVVLQLCELAIVVCQLTYFVSTSAFTNLKHTFMFHRQEKHAMYHMKQKAVPDVSLHFKL